MKFNILTNEIKTRELIELEEAPSLAKTVRMMARFMVDEETGQRVPEPVAYQELLDLSAEEIQAVQLSFMESFVPNQKTGAK
jgi:hypothetical protein